MKVYLEDGADNSAQTMFFNNKIEVTNYDKADVVLFGGGADVSPHLYGEYDSHLSWSDPLRDEHCEDLFHMAVRDGKFLSGICRGAQFLNVMFHGTMVQDCRGHTTSHYCTWGDDEVWVTSTHHQIIMPNLAHVKIEAVSRDKLCREYHLNSKHTLLRLTHGEVEAISADNMFATQFHPEYVGQSDPMQIKFIKELNERQSLWHQKLKQNQTETMTNPYANL